jgi:Cu/Ag efflux protein CusF
MKIFILLILILTAFDCGKSTANKPARTDSATPAPTTSTPKNGNYNGKGVVTKINLKDVSVEMDHEEIVGLMPAMRMEFYVREKAELEKLSVGDKVEFVVEYKDGQENIVGIKKTQ